RASHRKTAESIRATHRASAVCPSGRHSVAPGHGTAARTCLYGSGQRLWLRESVQRGCCPSCDTRSELLIGVIAN
ncbi:MAG: hypothetical protein RMJ88_13135, partial [Thermogemmata sp.]|nr:hypothetical protein [Thermogemmata sp.]